jgi:hypothetical protein
MSNDVPLQSQQRSFGIASLRPGIANLVLNESNMKSRYRISKKKEKSLSAEQFALHIISETTSVSGTNCIVSTFF